MTDTDTNSGIEPADSSSDESVGGLVVIVFLIVVIGCLVVACGLLWGGRNDVRLRAEIDARMKVVEAEAKAASALQEAKVLRDQNASLRAALEVVKTQGSPNPPPVR